MNMKQKDIEVRNKYRADHAKRMELAFWYDKDGDILAFFDTIESRSRTAFIKEAIREKIERDKK